MLTPSRVSCRIAGMPAGVAGTLIITLERASRAQNRRASAIVPAVSSARCGEISRLTNPSCPSVSS